MKRLKSINTRSRILIASLFTGIMAIVILLWPNPPEKMAESGFTAIVHTITPQNAREPIRNVIRPNASPSTPAPISRLPRNARLTMEEVDDIRLYGLSPELLHFVDLRSKAVRSRDDITDTIALASDRGLIDEAAFELMHHDPNEQQALARRRRITLVDFLRFALMQGNESSYVAQVIRTIVQSEPVAEGEPMEIRKTFAGDRIELLWALKVYDPAEFERAREDAAGSPAEKLIEYMARNHSEP